ncbi:C2 domain protein [Leptodontidium sp. MPI-SDFR-AT-0119]|nr:C2 domain protein [Leptodontidium sp. MPI-SDFR-AT-0119]
MAAGSNQYDTGATGGTIPASVLLGKNSDIPEVGDAPRYSNGVEKPRDESTAKATGGLYSTWEGIQPTKDDVNGRGITRKPLPSESAAALESIPTNASTIPPGDTTIGASKPLPPTPAASATNLTAPTPDSSSLTPSSANLTASNIPSDIPQRKEVPRSVSGRPQKVEPTPFGQAYSARNPPPTVEGFRENEKKRQEQSRQYFAEGTEEQGQEEKTADTTGHESTTKDEDGARAGATEDVPIGAEKSNVLFQPTPSVDLSQAFQTIHKDARTVSYVICAAVVLLDLLFIGGGWKGVFKSLFPAAGVAGGVYFILINVGDTTSSRGIEQAEPKVEKLRYVPESVEWMNSLVGTLWRTLQQEFFDGIATQVNDTIKPLIPEGIPVAVKIAKLGHGAVPVRILSMRSLPDSEFGALVPSHGDRRDASPVDKAERDKAIEREQGGVFYNLEIAVAYHEAPLRPRTDAMHVDIVAMLGPVPLPIFVQVKEFVATVRVRLQMHPDLPFLKNMTFALTENPQVNTAVSLGAPWAFDILNLPLIDKTLVSQINDAAQDFVQPKSMSLDMTVYVGGSDQKEDTESIGVLFVKIHRARSLARQDSRGPGADPYLTIAFSKYEKPMYATRIIKGDRNPVWEETAIIMIKAEHVKRNENVLLRLWDSDTTGSDDVSGVCEFPLHELVLKANEMQKREDQLQGDVEGTDAEGVLEWEIGYFPRAEYHKALRTDAKDPRDHRGEKIEVPEEEKVQNAQNTVPDPNLPSGILAFTIHQCINVEVNNPNKKSMGYVEVQKQDDDGEDEGEAENVSIDYIPSLYVSADINDQLVYRTRVKHISSTPTYNSSTETYIRDWRLATLNLSVWDTRKKTDDCLVGVAAVKLSEIFHESSSVVKFYNLKGGEGTGRIRVSMIFRSMKMKLEESLLGYSVGSFVFSSPIVAKGDMNTSKINIRASGSRRVIKNGSSSEEGYTWTLEEPQNIIPVSFRYLSPVVIEFVGSGLTEKIGGPLGKSKHYAVLWLHKLVDNKEATFTLPIYKTNNKDRLIQNVVDSPDDTMTLDKVGEVTFTAKFKAGIDEAHEEFLDGHNQWCTFKAWKAARESGEATGRSSQ